jgi:hypothetical protein
MGVPPCEARASGSLADSPSSLLEAPSFRGEEDFHGKIKAFRGVPPPEARASGLLADPPSSHTKAPPSEGEEVSHRKRSKLRREERSSGPPPSPEDDPVNDTEAQVSNPGSR